MVREALGTGASGYIVKADAGRELLEGCESRPSRRAGLSATDLLAMISSEPRIDLTLKAFHAMTVSHGVKTETWE